MALERLDGHVAVSNRNSGLGASGSLPSKLERPFGFLGLVIELIDDLTSVGSGLELVGALLFEHHVDVSAFELNVEISIGDRLEIHSSAL